MPFNVIKTKSPENGAFAVIYYLSQNFIIIIAAWALVAFP